MSQPTAPLMAHVAQVVPCTEAEGPGRRFALWFQGCPLRCPGCCNPEFLPFRGGETLTLADLTTRIVQARDTESIEGITLLGGEPFAHAEAAAAIAGFARDRELSVMVFTGYLREVLEARSDHATAALLATTDILVDGPYRREEPDGERRWIGSRNQRIHFLTDRYQADDPYWRQRNTLELRVNRDGVSLNGFPGQDAASLWKGWTRKRRDTPIVPVAPDAAPP